MGGVEVSPETDVYGSVTCSYVGVSFDLELEAMFSSDILGQQFLQRHGETEGSLESAPRPRASARQRTTPTRHTHKSGSFRLTTTSKGRDKMCQVGKLASFWDTLNVLENALSNVGVSMTGVRGGLLQRADFEPCILRPPPLLVRRADTRSTC